MELTRVRTMTMSLALLLVAAFAAVPGSVADHKETNWGNRGSCETTLLQAHTGTILTGKSCVLDNVNFLSGDDVDLDVFPITGYDVQSVNFSLYHNDRSTLNQYDEDAEAVWWCVEGFVDEVYVECPEVIERGASFPNLPYGDYTAVMKINVNQTEITPTIAGISVPTQMFLSGGNYGFQVWYNLR